MPRKYVKLIGARGNCNYDKRFLVNAIREVNSGRISIRAASEKYAIPYTTLRRWVKIKDLKKYGGQAGLAIDDENMLVAGLLECAKWGFPLQKKDILDVVENYLNRRGIRSSVFKNNRPGDDWFENFMKRQPQLTYRFSENIKRSRAAVTRETIAKYFENLELTLRDVPPSNVVNYDETNFCDDPQAKKVIVRRGTKHPERVMDSSKSSTSVMFCAAADGTVLPPYIVYKAKHIYAGWTEGGVAGSAYNRNDSGWFDTDIFEDWFHKILLPYFRRLEGPKVMVGDNLASHITSSVIENCVANDIKFVLLPPNTTHLCQPLDVAYFRPLKIAWRTTLEKWKKGHIGVISKVEFPKLLKQTLENIQKNSKKNVEAGFEACGIVPFNPQAVLKKVPSSEKNAGQQESWTDTFTDLLKELRSPTGDKKKPRGKKLQISPGKAIVPQNISQKNTSSKAKEGNIQQEEIVDDPALGENKLLGHEDLYERGESSHHLEGTDLASKGQENWTNNDFVIVEFKTQKSSRFFVGKILQVNEGSVEIKFLRKKASKKDDYFVFPIEDDIREVDPETIIKKVSARELRRERFLISPNDPRLE